MICYTVADNQNRIDEMVKASPAIFNECNRDEWGQMSPLLPHALCVILFNPLRSPMRWGLFFPSPKWGNWGSEALRFWGSKPLIQGWSWDLHPRLSDDHISLLIKCPDSVTCYIPEITHSLWVKEHLCLTITFWALCMPGTVLSTPNSEENKPIPSPLLQSHVHPFNPPFSISQVVFTIHISQLLYCLNSFRGFSLTYTMAIYKPGPMIRVRPGWMTVNWGAPQKCIFSGCRFWFSKSIYIFKIPQWFLYSAMLENTGQKNDVQTP